MTRDKILKEVEECVLEIASEADFARLLPDRSWRDQLDIDSFDFLNVLISIYRRMGVGVPEADYEKVTTLNGLVGYLSRKLDA